MSTKTFPEVPGNPFRNEPVFIFLVLSVLIHLGLGWGLFSFSELKKNLLLDEARKKNEPIAVDVIDLPPGEVKNEAPEKPPSFFADRTQSFKEETFPETGKSPIKAAPRALPKPIPPSVVMPERKTAPPVEKSTPVEKAVPAEVKERTADKAPEKPVVTGKEELEKSEETYPIPAEKGIGEAEFGTGKELAKKEIAPERPIEKPASPPEPKGAGKEALKEKTDPAKPNLFLTDERIAELNKKYEAEAPQGEKGKTLQLNTSELKYQKYLLDLKQRIEFYWEYPGVASRNGWQGKLRIDFTINKDGTVKEISILKSSNYAVLDSAAVDAIRLAAPFAPLPTDFGIEDLNIKGQFEYIFQSLPIPVR